MQEKKEMWPHAAAHRPRSGSPGGRIPSGPAGDGCVLAYNDIIGGRRPVLSSKKAQRMATPRGLILPGPRRFTCDAEAQFAFEKAAMPVAERHSRQPPAAEAARSSLHRHQILVVTGRLHLRRRRRKAGKILANQLKHFLGDALQKFRDQEKLILGISTRL